jgi:hypothetical protein
MDTLSITAGHDLAPTIDRTPHLLLSAATPVQYLPLPHGVLDVLEGLGADTVADITSFTPDELEDLHGLGQAGRLLIEQLLVSNRLPWDGATLRAKPTLKAREAGKVTLVEAGLTEAAQAELADRNHTTLRHVTTWDADTLASVFSVETYAEAEAALSWYGLSFIDTARTENFVEGVRHIREHYEEHGFVPGAREVYKGFRLGQWVMMTRGNYNSGKMDPSRIHVLEGLPYWTWTGGHGQGVTAKRLADILEAARVYGAEHGHLDVPTDDGHAFLHRGLKTVREAREHLSPAAVADFEALPDWTWDQAEADIRRRDRFTTQSHERPPSPQWLARLDELHTQVVAAGGLDKAPLRGNPEVERIGHWVSTQRVRRASLSSAQRELLEAVPGWTWDGMAARDARRWNEAAIRLEAYVAAGNSPDVAALFRHDGFGLGDWVRRQHLNRENLTPEQVERLEAVPGWAWRESNPRRSRTPQVPRATRIRRELKWEATRRLALAFFEEHHFWPSYGTTTAAGLDLGHWVITQRSRHSRGELAPRREAALDATPGWRWNGQAQRGRTGPNLRHVCTTLGIEPGAVLLARGTKYEAEALLDDQYRVEVVSSPGEGAYETPTRAWSRATAGRSLQNGWDTWSIEFKGEMTPLRSLRNLVAEMDIGMDVQAGPSEGPS